MHQTIKTNTIKNIHLSRELLDKAQEIFILLDDKHNAENPQDSLEYVRHERFNYVARTYMQRDDDTVTLLSYYTNGDAGLEQDDVEGLMMVTLDRTMIDDDSFAAVISAPDKMLQKLDENQLLSYTNIHQNNYESMSGQPIEELCEEALRRLEAAADARPDINILSQI